MFLYQALENGVSMWPKLEGRFPQVSSAHFIFDIYQIIFKHKIDATALSIKHCSKCQDFATREQFRNNHRRSTGSNLSWDK